MAEYSLRGYAKLTGRSLAGVQKAIESGRLSPPAYAVEIKNGKKVYTVNSEIASQQWSDNTGTRRTMTRGEINPDKVGNLKTPSEKIKPNPPPVTTTSKHGKSINEAGDSKTANAYQTARAIKEGADAQIQLLKLKQMRGSLVDIEKLKAVLYPLAKGVTQNMMSIPSRIKLQLAAELDPEKIDDILTNEIKIALRSIANADFLK